MSDATTTTQQPRDAEAMLAEVMTKWVALRGHPALLFRSSMIGAKTMLRVQQTLGGKGVNGGGFGTGGAAGTGSPGGSPGSNGNNGQQLICQQPEGP